LAVLNSSIVEGAIVKVLFSILLIPAMKGGDEAQYSSGLGSSSPISNNQSLEVSKASVHNVSKL
tara:strand:- start:13765 stop:13956 length:192 start_codon:yes stop_codon:yes gene_type:complete